jgi:hypothetical protein
MKIGILSDFEIGIRVLKMRKLAHEPVHTWNGPMHVKFMKILTLFWVGATLSWNGAWTEFENLEESWASAWFSFHQCNCILGNLNWCILTLNWCVTYGFNGSTHIYQNKLVLSLCELHVILVDPWILTHILSCRLTYKQFLFKIHWITVIFSL